MTMSGRIGLFALVSVNLYLVSQVYAFQKETTALQKAESQEQTAIHDLNRLKRIAGNDFQGEYTATLFVFIQADGECQCIDDWRYWKMALERPGLRVIGIFNGRSTQKVVDFVNGVSLGMPVYVDSERRLQSNYHVVPNQIVKVLVNRSYQVLLADANATSDKSQKEFHRRLLEHLDRLN